MNRMVICGSISRLGDPNRRNDAVKETFIDTKVTYTLELEGKLYVIENVPARVCRETGEQLFSPETVGHLQRAIWEKKKPKRVIETPVYEYGQVADLQ